MRSLLFCRASQSVQRLHVVVITPVVELRLVPCERRHCELWVALRSSRPQCHALVLSNGHHPLSHPPTRVLDYRCATRQRMWNSRRPAGIVWHCKRIRGYSSRGGRSEIDPFRRAVRPKLRQRISQYIEWQRILLSGRHDTDLLSGVGTADTVKPRLARSWWNLASRHSLGSPGKSWST